MARSFFYFKSVKEGKIEFKSLLKTSLPFVPTYISGFLASYSDRIIILLMIGGDYYIGLYALLYRIAQIGGLGVNIISQGFLPIMYNNYKTSDGGRFKQENI